MAVFATHVVLMRDFQAVAFAPGDELPEWAEGLVGDHVLEPEAADASEPDADPDVPDGDQADDQPAPEAPASDEPDFTTPAPVRRRGRAQR